MHAVVGRETLWSIAEEQLGSAQRWKEIAALNYQRVQSDGGQLTADHWVRPGWELLLPGNGETAHGGSRADTDPRSPIDRTEITTTDPMATAVPAGPLAAPVATVAPSEQQPKAANTASAPKPSMVPIAPIAPIAPVGAGIVGVGVVDLSIACGGCSSAIAPGGRASDSRIRTCDTLSSGCGWVMGPKYCSRSTMPSSCFDDGPARQRAECASSG